MGTNLPTGPLGSPGVGRIDLYQFHWPDEIATPVDSWHAMVRLV